MPRPPLPIGTYGKIRTVKEAGGTWTARAGFRDYDGITRDVERAGPTRVQAENALREALRDRAKIVGNGDLTPDTKVKDLAEQWWSEWKRQPHSPNTTYNYRRKMDLFILRGLGELRLREFSVARANRFLRDIEDNHGASNAKMTRTVLSLMGAFAAQQGAIASNPVRDVGRISVGSQPATALTIAQVSQLLAYMTYDPQAIDRDVVDFAAFLASTGVRHAEALGLQQNAIDFEAGTAAIRHQVIRIVGVGLVLKRPKSEAGVRTLELPSWALRLLELRQLTAAVPRVFPTVKVLQANGTIVEERLSAETMLVFPSTRTGTYGLRDPRNVHRQVKDAYAFAGLGGGNHKFRKMVLTEMDKAGLSARAAADQAGHAKVSMTQDAYFGRRVVRTGAAEVLEAIGAAL